MAIKQVVTQGIGFDTPSYLLTDGFGDFSPDPPPGDPPDPRSDRRRRGTALRTRGRKKG